MSNSVVPLLDHDITDFFDTLLVHFNGQQRIQLFDIFVDCGPRSDWKSVIYVEWTEVGGNTKGRKIDCMSSTYTKECKRKEDTILENREYGNKGKVTIDRWAHPSC